MKPIKGFEFVKTDRDVYYFNYLSKANQIYEITVCQECESQPLTPIEEGEDCPSCGDGVSFLTTKELMTFLILDRMMMQLLDLPLGFIILMDRGLLFRFRAS